MHPTASSPARGRMATRLMPAAFNCSTLRSLTSTGTGIERFTLDEHIHTERD